MPPDSVWGLLLLDKPEGLTSHTATNRAARALGFKKAGHAGTLDPMATGLLLVGLGKGTRLLEFLVGCDKTYVATIRFGIETDTLDREGCVLREEETPELPRERIESALGSLTGRILQIPPIHSAIKVGGEALYRKARRGEEAEVPPREVTVHSIEILSYDHPLLEMKVECSSGTYVRSLARDLGALLGFPASLWALRRTRCGPFDVADASTLVEVAGARLLEPSAMVCDLPRADAAGEDVIALLHGRTVELPNFPDAENVAVFSHSGELAAICKAEGGVLSPRKVLLDQIQ